MEQVYLVFLACRASKISITLLRVSVADGFVVFLRNDTLCWFQV